MHEIKSCLGEGAKVLFTDPNTLPPHYFRTLDFAVSHDAVMRSEVKVTHEALLSEFRHRNRRTVFKLSGEIVNIGCRLPYSKSFCR